MHCPVLLILVNSMGDGSVGFAYAGGVLQFFIGAPREEGDGNWRRCGALLGGSTSGRCAVACSDSSSAGTNGGVVRGNEAPLECAAADCLGTGSVVTACACSGAASWGRTAWVWYIGGSSRDGFGSLALLAAAFGPSGARNFGVRWAGSVRSWFVTVGWCQTGWSIVVRLVVAGIACNEVGLAIGAGVIVAVGGDEMR
jgi:hypothetical protein